MGEAINRVKSLRREADGAAEASEQARLARKLARRLRIQRGLGGRKLGRHRVPEVDVDVQISEDLSESFRALKVCLCIAAIQILR